MSEKVSGGQDFALRIEAALLPLGPVQAKRMFGGHGVFLEGLMFALIAGDRLYLKVDDETKALFAEAGAEPFVYRGKTRPVEMSYWSLPVDPDADREAFLAWARVAIDAARRARRKNKPRKDRG